MKRMLIAVALVVCVFAIGCVIPFSTECAADADAPVTSESLRAQIEAGTNLQTKLATAVELYKAYPKESLPAVKALLLEGIDYAALKVGKPDSDYYKDLGAILIALQKSEETDLVADTLKTWFSAASLPHSSVALDRLLNERDTYLITAESVLQYGKFRENSKRADINNFYSMLVHTWFYKHIGRAGTLDGEFASAKSFAAQIVSLLPQKSYLLEEALACPKKRSFALKMPELSAEAASAVPENKKCIVVFRFDRDGDIENWYIDMGFMSTLPADAIPESLAEANILLTVNTKWEFTTTYYCGAYMIRGYRPKSTVMAYSFPEGRLLRKFEDVTTAMPNTITVNTLYGVPLQTAYYVEMDSKNLLAQIGTVIADYCEAK